MVQRKTANPRRRNGFMVVVTMVGPDETTLLSYPINAAPVETLREKIGKM